MKKTMLLLLALASVMSCQKIDVADEGQQECVKQKKDVQFVIGGITEEYGTRGTISSVGCTDLWVYEGSTLLKHQVSTDEDFGLPTVSLTYGAHDLTFVASASDGQGFSTQWTCTKVRETFGKVMQVTVSGGSSTSRQVQLKRRNSAVMFTIEDEVPSGVKTMHIKAGSHLGLNGALVGQEASVYEVTADVSKKVGMTGFSPTVTVMPASASEEEDCDVMIEFLSAEGVVLYHYERTVKVKANRRTNLTGSYFQGDAQEVTVNELWEDEFEVAL